MPRPPPGISPPLRAVSSVPSVHEKSPETPRAIAPATRVDAPGFRPFLWLARVVTRRQHRSPASQAAKLIVLLAPGLRRTAGHPWRRQTDLQPSGPSRHGGREI